MAIWGAIWGTGVITVFAALVLVPCLVLLIQCSAAALPKRNKMRSAANSRPSLGILVPAHNEELVIAATIKSIAPQLGACDRLVVIADNCDDATAKIASDSGAEVLVRHDRTRRGKGFALQVGLDRLREQPPGVVIVIDADCRLEPNCIDFLAREVAATNRPVQGRYLMNPPAQPRPRDVISSLAVLLKNRVRPLGMRKLGLPCLITGSGSAFPWQALEARTFAGANIVEDMQLAVDLALAGLAPVYCDSAILTAVLPDRSSAFVSQRRRWEHGHLQTLISQSPRLLWRFLKTGRIELLGMTADLAVPPLSLLIVITALVFATSMVAGLAGTGWTAAGLTLTACAALVASVLIAWFRFAREVVPFWIFLTIPAYVLSKLPLYVGFLFHPERSWIRTTRSGSDETQLQQPNNPA